MRQNVPPAHFGYMASGIDDEVTLRAQPRGLPEVPAPAAPPGRRQQGRHERRHPRHQIQFADRARAGRRPALVPRRRRARRRRAAKVGNHLQILSTMTYDVGRGRDQGARRADLVPALRHQQVRGRRGITSSAPRTPAASPSRSRSTAAADATRKRCSGCGRATRATATAATTAPASQTNLQGPAMFEGRRSRRACATSSRRP